MEENDITIACSPVAWGGPVSEGATTATCWACFCPIWVAPSSRDILALHPHAILGCVACVTASNSDEEVIHVAPGSLSEVARIDPDVAAWLAKRVAEGLTVGELRAWLEERA